AGHVRGLLGGVVEHHALPFLPNEEDGVESRDIEDRVARCLFDLRLCLGLHLIELFQSVAGELQARLALGFLFLGRQCRLRSLIRGRALPGGQERCGEEHQGLQEEDEPVAMGHGVFSLVWWIGIPRYRRPAAGRKERVAGVTARAAPLPRSRISRARAPCSRAACSARPCARAAPWRAWAQ